MIKHIRIQNYKSLGDVAVDLDPVTVLIGKSGTGKSNFVDAIRFLRDYLRDSQTVDHTRGGWQMIRPAAIQPGSLLFHVRFAIDQIEGDFEYHLKLKWGEPAGAASFFGEGLFLGSQCLFAQENRKWTTPPTVLPLPEPGSLAINRISGVTEISVAYVALTEGIGCYDFPNDVLKKVGDSSKSPGLADNGANFLQVFTAIENNLHAMKSRRAIEESLGALNRSVKSLTLNRPQQTTISVGHDVNGQRLSFLLGQESEGLRRFLAHLLALYQSPPKQLLVFEEPEKGIYPAALAHLAGEFEICPRQRRGHVLLTTHSPEMLNYFKPEQFRVVEIEDYRTKIGRLATDQLDSIREKLILPGEIFTVNHPRLAEAPPAAEPVPP
jgi:predicted ATPase